MYALYKTTTCGYSYFKYRRIFDPIIQTATEKKAI
jgi:hypothetical protein